MKETIILNSLKDADFRTLKLPMIVVYNNPSDFPGKYAAKIWEAATATPTNCIIIRSTPEEIREDIKAAGFQTLFPRAAGDSPEIIESWM